MTPKAKASLLALLPLAIDLGHPSVGEPLEG